MKPHQWLDVLDIAMRILTIIRQLLAELWGGHGEGNGQEPTDANCP